MSLPRITTPQELAEFIKRESQLNPQDEPVYKRLLMESKLWQMSDMIDQELEGFKFFYDIFARLYFNMLRKSIFRNLSQEDLYQMMKVSFVFFEACAQRAVNDLFQQKQAGKQVNPVNVGEKLYFCVIEALELHTAPLTRR